MVKEEKFYKKIIEERLAFKEIKEFWTIGDLKNSCKNVKISIYKILYMYFMRVFYEFCV